MLTEDQGLFQLLGIYSEENKASAFMKFRDEHRKAYNEQINIKLNIAVKFSDEKYTSLRSDGQNLLFSTECEKGPHWGGHT